jgi:hypothetical protein
MGSTLEMTIVGVVVGAALVWAIWAGWKAVKSRGVCSSCGSSGECPLASNPEAMAELGQKVRLNHPDSFQPDGPSCQELAGTLEKQPSAELRESKSQPAAGP